MEACDILVSRNEWAKIKPSVRDFDAMLRMKGFRMKGFRTSGSELRISCLGSTGSHHVARGQLQEGNRRPRIPTLRLRGATWRTCFLHPGARYLNENCTAYWIRGPWTLNYTLRL